jgi:curved DNA-binding protein CbpA
MAQGRVNPHSVLGLAPGATRADVRRAFRGCAHATHPDHGGDPAAFLAVRDAYEQLRNAVPADARAARVHGAYATTCDLDLSAFPASPAAATSRPRRRPVPAPAGRAFPAGGFASLLEDALSRLTVA